MAKRVGIDLGTTNSVVAILDGPRPKILDNRESKPATRSVIGLKRRGGQSATDAEIIVGDVAVDNWERAPNDTIISIKRLMGRGVGDPEVQKARQWADYEIVEPSKGTKDSVRVVMGGKEYSPVDISAIILKKLVDDAEFRLGERPTEAVITVPAYFTHAQKAATREAGQRAGLRVLKLLDEPTAAAIAYGLEAGHSGEAKTILVYDFGGGTFDISILVMSGGNFACLNKQGDMWLGGDNLDQLIVERVVRHVKEEFGVDPGSRNRFMAALKKAAQAVKERLAAAPSADLMVTGLLTDDSGNIFDVDLTVTRDEFERMVLPLVATYRECACGQANFPKDDRCASCGSSLQGAPVKDGKTIQIVRKAMENAHLKPDEIDYVLMAGNSTNAPLVQQSVEELFGKEKILRNIQPKHCVAMGAAIVAALLAGKVCPAPDPSDPSAECGKVNALDAEVCEKCGAPLELELPKDSLPGEPLEDSVAPDVQVGIGGGDIAPVHYGAELAGDKFSVFVRKGDPYPTESPQAQTFFTRRPNARMISIPIRGGEDLQQASANDKQGQAFAILPAGLPQDTPVRVKLWLDDEGEFLLEAHLQDGADLKPWIVKGEADAKAIEAIEKVEMMLASTSEAVPPAQLNKLEEARNRAFELMKQRDFEGALQVAQKMVEEAASIGERTPEERAESLIGYTEFVLHQYGWVLDQQQMFRLTNLVQETKTALEQHDREALERTVAHLEEETDQLQEAVRVFIGMKGAIAARVRPRDMALAATLLQEMDAVESAFKSRDPAAERKFEAFAERVVKAITELEQKYRASCDVCGEELEPGAHYCPNGHDTWQLSQGMARR